MNSAPITLRAGRPRGPIACWLCGKNWDPAATDRYRIDVADFPACANEQECNERATIAGLRLLLAECEDAAATPPPRTRLKAVPSPGAGDTEPTRRLRTVQEIEDAGAERARQLPPMTQEQAQRIAPLLAAGLLNLMERRTEADPHPA